MEPDGDLFATVYHGVGIIPSRLLRPQILDFQENSLGLVR